MSAPLRLRVGESITRQQSPVTCGAAAAAVARMLVDAPFAAWIRSGEGSPVLGAEGSTLDERFATYERTVHQRTNGLRRPGVGVDLPWPTRLGTPPWGVRSELEVYGSLPGTAYEQDLLRQLSTRGLERLYERLTEVVVDGEPAALYVGSATLPRHVVLVLPGARRELLAVFEPAAGRVVELDQDAFVARSLELGGWSHPWLVVRPTGHRRVHAPGPALGHVQLPRLAPDTAPEPLHRNPA